MEVISNPFWGFLGGLLIGLAAAGLLIINGKIAGVSGILGGSLFSSFSDRSWRLAFLVGLPLGGFFAMRFEAVPDAFEVSADPILFKRLFENEGFQTPWRLIHAAIYSA